MKNIVDFDIGLEKAWLQEKEKLASKTIPMLTLFSVIAIMGYIVFDYYANPGSFILFLFIRLSCSAFILMLFIFERINLISANLFGLLLLFSASLSFGYMTAVSDQTLFVNYSLAFNSVFIFVSILSFVNISGFVNVSLISVLLTVFMIDHYGHYSFKDVLFNGGTFIFVGFGFSLLSLIARTNLTNSNFKANQNLQETNSILSGKNREITDSINYAKYIQNAILPSLNSFRDKLPPMFILYKPKDIIAGDFYWMEKKDGFLYIAVADCTGHGVPGALVSVVCSNALNRAFNESDIIMPGRILDKTRDYVMESLTKGDTKINDGMDISICALNRKTKEIFWSGAHNPLWYFSKGQMNEIKADKQPIGKSYNLLPFNTYKIQLDPGDTFYLFTDGYADQFGGENAKKLKYRSFYNLLASVSSSEISRIKEELDIFFNNWKGTLEQVDDVTVLGIRID